MSELPQCTAARLRAAFEAEDSEGLAPLLHPAVRWGGEAETPETCHGREEVIAWYGKLRAAGISATGRRDRAALVALASETKLDPA